MRVRLRVRVRVRVGVGVRVRVRVRVRARVDEDRERCETAAQVDGGGVGAIHRRAVLRRHDATECTERRGVGEGLPEAKQHPRGEELAEGVRLLRVRVRG